MNNYIPNTGTGSVERWFEDQAEQFPTSIAVQFDDESITYSQLNQKANRLARKLLELELKPASRVVICVEPSLLTAIAILGVLKAGGTYVPVSSSYPEDRIAYILNDAQAPILLTQESLVSRVGRLSPNVIILDQGLESLNNFDTGNLKCINDPQQTAYVLYTSGSSGSPKGVMVSHKSLAYYLQWHCRHLREQIDHIDLPLTSSMCFAAGVTQFYTPLLLGRTLHILREDTIRQPDRLFSWYQKHPQFGIYCVPTLWNELVTFAEEQHKVGNMIEGPKCVLLSGEAVNEKLIEHSFKVWPEIKLMNLYGPTEAVANCSVGELHSGKPVTLGIPIAGTQIYLVDETMRPVSPGEAGELCICGDGVASGYLNLPELSRERFVPNPFGKPEERLFKTGDLAKYNDQGELIFIGRKDFQVKIRGYRIECGEIEHTLLEHPAIRQTLVICREMDALEKQLVAYFTFHLARYASVDDIRQFLASRLPDYMVPAVFVALEAFPLLPNGKIDRKKLPAPGNVRPNLAYAFVPPKNVRQKQIVQIWEEVLNLEGLGINDNFFDLGGNSLKIAAAISRIAGTLHVDVSYRHFFDHPTPAALATVFKGLKQESKRLAPAIEPIPSKSPYPSAVSQQSLWLLSQTHPDLTAYNIQFSLRFEGKLDFNALVKSVESILKCHESLRTVIRLKNDQPVLEIMDFAKPTVQVVDVQYLEANQREKEVERLATEDCNRLFQLENGPLFRFKLYRLAEKRHWFFVTIHHIIFDGRSINVFCGEFVNNYRAHRIADQLHQPSAAVIQYQDYVAWQNHQIGGPDNVGLVEFWKQNLEGSSRVLDFPTDYIRPAIRSFKGTYEKIRIATDLKNKLLDFSLREQATPFMTLFTVFKILLYRYSNQEDILVGCPVANRNHSDTEDLIGFFANTIVLRTKLTKDQSFRKLLATVRETCLSSFEHSALPFEKLIEFIQPERSLSYTPVFQVMFAYHEQLFKGWVDEHLWLNTYEDGNNAAKYDFVLDAQDMEGEIELRLTYSTELFAKQTMLRFLEQYTRLLASVLDNPEKSVSEYELNSKAELRKIVVDWNSTAFDNPRNRCLHRLFEEQAARSPDQIALIFGEQRLTYDGLNRHANQLARHLITQGVKKGVIVGVCMEISTDMIVALLAILKAGGTYVPLDPYYPKERIAYIIEDSCVPIIVTQQNLEEQLSSHQASLISTDAEWKKIAENHSDNPVGDTEPEELIYLMYTSGSTGNPKGVMVPHKGACNYVLWMQHQFPLSAEDKILNKTSINFDISVWEIFLPLITGAQLVLGKKDDLQAPEGLAALIQKEQITNIQLVPSALKTFVDSGTLSSCSSLKRIFSGGEALSVKLQEEVFESFSGELHNLYGPTEASIYVCHWVCRREDRLRSVPIGRPIHNARVYILDAQLKPVPVGMAGELYIGGEVLAKGYLNKPDINAVKFIQDPHSDDPDAKLFYTGDLARYLSDGNIEFIGRADRQVKVRGYRIELGEIEHILTKHPQVNHAIVIVREDKIEDVRLVAYLLYREKNGPDNAELREYLKQKLPGYMIPSLFVELDSIPLLPNNKVNFKALPRPEYQKTLDKEMERNYRNDCEKNLAQIWEEVLETEKFGANDSFFEVGGHSLLITKMQILIEQKFGIEVSNIELFQYPNIRSLAQHITNKDQPVSKAVSNMARRAELRNRRFKPRTAETKELI
jgi:amino acid adenylation domain-containing protein